MTSFAEEVILAAKSSSNASLLSQAGSDGLLQLVDKLDGCGEAEIFKDFQGALMSCSALCSFENRCEICAGVETCAAVVEAGVAVDYLHAILLASPSASVRGKRRRLLCFAKGIKVTWVLAEELIGVKMQAQ
jgi:hypothetical protein